MLSLTCFGELFIECISVLYSWFLVYEIHFIIIQLLSIIKNLFYN